MIAPAFWRILSAAALAGLLAGILLTGLQQFRVVPAILEAEQYELVGDAGDEAHEGHEGHDHGAHSHAHEWAPEDGAERTFYTALANVSMAVGFGLLLGAVMSLRKEPPNWRAGLLWGGAGYLVFFLAPALGLPPELPGTEAAAVSHRQMWWLLTVAATAGGLALLVFGRGPIRKLIGCALFVVPFVLGAPQPEVHASTAPAALTRDFLFATATVNAAFWLVLGALTAFFYKRAD